VAENTERYRGVIATANSDFSSRRRHASVPAATSVFSKSFLVSCSVSLRLCGESSCVSQRLPGEQSPEAN
jgi:hypothetical protein